MTDTIEITTEKLCTIVTNGEIAGLLYAIVTLESIKKYSTVENAILHLQERIKLLEKNKNSINK
ncbi:MAG: hypothetical protein AABY22_07970 [Nanoarchaeota archaeon]